ncbi:hypothetical protein R1sor_010672 [Riccia sorocarpa]|uniref:ABC transporter domain-containing protein n=1 Tax=Riccia sorocarpa TaxID=122646 RepID=A0ABD3I2R8_9MARC
MTMEVRATMHALSPISTNLHERIKNDVKVEDEIYARLSWRNLTVVVNGNQSVLHDISGFAEPGRLLAIMGPSGSGKSTLLEGLAGRLSNQAQCHGEILLNGRKEQLSYGTAAYVSQDDVLLGTLTVYETLYYSAKLRLPDNMTRSETELIVKKTIEDVGLQDSMSTPIGNWHQRGLSGGEKRRVSIAIELLTRPRLLFLDEPTSGLDSASAYHVVQALQNLARDGRTVICSIHQPSSEVFELFDDLCLLSGGKQVFYGPIFGAQEFFASAGVPCPALRNPSDHYLRTINSDFDRVTENLKSWSKRFDVEDGCLHNPMARKSTAEQVRILVHLFATSEEKRVIDNTILSMSKMEGKVLPTRGSQASFISGHYGVAAFSIGNTLSSLPFLLLISLASTTIVYLMVDLHSGMERFAYFVLALFASLMVVESLMMAVASLVPNFLLGIVTGASIQVLLSFLTPFLSYT